MNTPNKKISVIRWNLKCHQKWIRRSPTHSNRYFYSHVQLQPEGRAATQWPGLGIAGGKELSSWKFTVNFRFDNLRYCHLVDKTARSTFFLKKTSTKPDCILILRICLVHSLIYFDKFRSRVISEYYSIQAPLDESIKRLSFPVWIVITVSWFYYCQKAGFIT